MKFCIFPLLTGVLVYTSTFFLHMRLQSIKVFSMLNNGGHPEATPYALLGQGPQSLLHHFLHQYLCHRELCIPAHWHSVITSSQKIRSQPLRSHRLALGSVDRPSVDTDISSMMDHLYHGGFITLFIYFFRDGILLHLGLGLSAFIFLALSVHLFLQLHWIGLTQLHSVEPKFRTVKLSTYRLVYFVFCCED